jgi:hypothetical protein
LLTASSGSIPDLSPRFTRKTGVSESRILFFCSLGEVPLGTRIPPKCLETRRLRDLGVGHADTIFRKSLLSRRIFMSASRTLSSWTSRRSPRAGLHAR